MKEGSKEWLSSGASPRAVGQKKMILHPLLDKKRKILLIMCFRDANVELVAVRQERLVRVGRWGTGIVRQNRCQKQRPDQPETAVFSPSPRYFL